MNEEVPAGEAAGYGRPGDEVYGGPPRMKIPWERPVTWAVFLLVIYVLRHFFFIIFMTFIVSYSVRGLVVWTERSLFRTRGNRPAQVLLSVLFFLGILGGLYGVGAYLVPEFVSQGQELVKKVTNPRKSPKSQFDELLANTVGKWLFQGRYGEPNSERYVEAFGRFREGRREEEEFVRAADALEEDFGVYLYQKRLLETPDAPARPPGLPAGFQEWVLREKAPKELERDRARYEEEWESVYLKQEVRIPGITPLARFSDAEREAAVLRYVTGEMLDDEGLRAELEREWRRDAARRFASEFERTRPDDYKAAFDAFYREQKARRPEDFPYDPERFATLRAAAAKGPEEFYRTLADVRPESPEERLAREARIFERRERMTLLNEWKKGELAGKLQTKAEETVVSAMTKVAAAAGESIPKLLVLPMEILLVLLLSFLITVDVPRLSAGAARLRRSRARRVYEEIAPGLVNFARLIGRAFQAQGIIAVANTVLTLMAIKFLGIQNAVFLCTVVFICSFVPVLGVVFSSVPIALTAFIQEGGGLVLAVWSIVAILVVHFIETSMLNPKILGNMLHLHPVLTLAILAVSEHFFGVWGLLLGVPVMVYLIRSVVLGEGIPGLIELEPTERS